MKAKENSSDMSLKLDTDSNSESEPSARKPVKDKGTSETPPNKISFYVDPKILQLKNTEVNSNHHDVSELKTGFYTIFTAQRART